MEWNNIMHEVFISKNGDRVFRLKGDIRGVLGIGYAYYLETKLTTETEFKLIQSIVTNSDNHGLKLDIENFNYDMSKVFALADKIIEATF